MPASRKGVPVVVAAGACALWGSALAWAHWRGGAPNVDPGEFTAWSALVVVGAVACTFTASQFATPAWWLEVLKPRGVKLDAQGQAGLSVLSWWLLSGGLPAFLLVRFAIDPKAALPVNLLHAAVWATVAASVWAIARNRPGGLANP